MSTKLERLARGQCHNCGAAPGTGENCPVCSRWANILKNAKQLKLPARKASPPRNVRMPYPD